MAWGRKRPCRRVWELLEEFPLLIFAEEAVLSVFWMQKVRASACNGRGNIRRNYSMSQKSVIRCPLHCVCWILPMERNASTGTIPKQAERPMHSRRRWRQRIFANRLDSAISRCRRRLREGRPDEYSSRPWLGRLARWEAWVRWGHRPWWATSCSICLSCFCCS